MWVFVVIVSLYLGLMVLERKFPDRPLHDVPGWWARVIFITVVLQAGTVFCATFLWEPYLQRHGSVFQLRKHVSPFVGGVIAYLFSSGWFFYWWHLLRHKISFLWTWLHQIHHSASRIETSTSFYKHPLEIVSDSVLMAILTYSFLGLTFESSPWLSLFSAAGEYFYHMNIKTPQFIGLFFQRPEMHRFHHAHKGQFQVCNYADFPLADMLNGTYNNPPVATLRTGFDVQQETQFAKMIKGVDVLERKENKEEHIGGVVLLLVGCLQIIGLCVGSPTIKGIGFAFHASPLPLVFSNFNGLDTFATTFVFEAVSCEGVCAVDNLIFHPPQELTPELYSRLSGPYHLRNTYGVALSYGPAFDDIRAIEMRQQVLEFGLCLKTGAVKNSRGRVAKDLGYNSTIAWVDVHVRERMGDGSTTGDGSTRHPREWRLHVDCKELKTGIK